MAIKTIETLCELLNKKKALFVQYESCTDALNRCEIDNIEDYITTRSQLAIEIDKIDDEIQKICALNEDGAQLADAVANRCEYGSLPPEMKPLFSDAQEIFAIVNRVLAQEQSILQRFEHLRDELQEKIKASQNTPKIERYLNGLADKPQGETSYLGIKYGKV